ncbi:4615_t:CDS:1, partial [Entrophospora sp. SA101]
EPKLKRDHRSHSMLKGQIYQTMRHEVLKSASSHPNKEPKYGRRVDKNFQIKDKESDTNDMIIIIIMTFLPDLA